LDFFFFNRLLCYLKGCLQPFENQAKKKVFQGKKFTAVRKKKERGKEREREKKRGGERMV
jgi:hypothetical protein